MQRSLPCLALSRLSRPQPSDNGHNYQGTDIYVHHYVYGPPGRIRHVYHFQRQGPYHVGFVHGAPYPYAWASDRGGYYWQWRGAYGRW